MDEAYGTAEFMVHWSGEDDASGSGVHSYDLYVSQDDGLFQQVASNLTETSYQFTGGVSGSTYGFVTLARDNVGNVEPMPTVADAETLVIIGAWINKQNRFDVNARSGVTALDALIVINELGKELVFDPKTRVLTPLPPTGYAPPYVDVTMDGKITGLDALQVINEVRRQTLLSQQADGERITPLPKSPTRALPERDDAERRIDDLYALEGQQGSWLSFAVTPREVLPDRTRIATPQNGANTDTPIDPVRLEETLTLMGDDLAQRLTLAQ
jgi:hypothetical protein